MCMVNRNLFHVKNPYRYISLELLRRLRKSMVDKYGRFARRGVRLIP